MKRMRVYLDWAAAAPVTKSALRAFVSATKSFANPQSPHEEGRAARTLLEDARTRIARLTGAKASAVVFTGGATESNTLAILGLIRARIASGILPSDMHVLYLPSAHASTREAVAACARMGVRTEGIPLMDGQIDIPALSTRVTAQTVLVALDAVCGETGTRFAVREAAQVIARINPSTLVHVDASQLPLVEAPLRTRLGAHLLTLDAQKVGGVRGIGVLIVPDTITLMPESAGGGQERGMRPGTPAPALAQAFAVALETCEKERTKFAVRAHTMRTTLITNIQTFAPDAVVNGDTTVPHILNVSFLGRDTEFLAMRLNTLGYAVSTRSACATDAPHSIAVKALRGNTERATSTLRISWGPSTKERDLQAFTRTLKQALTFIDAHTL